MGPFVRATDNMGYSIDGNIFIDDDGKWYFYHAGSSGIYGSQMLTPTTFGTDVNIVPAMSGQWTEGPEMIKRHGKYYLFCCGNHYLARGYRTNLSVSSKSPLSDFELQTEQNPILVSTDGIDNFYGLGHGSVVIGPDLDTYFFCYHNIISSGGSNVRYMNIDRIGWNGDKLMMYGPTTWEQPAPIIANNDYFDRTDVGNNWKLYGGIWSIKENDHLNQSSSGDSRSYALKTDEILKGDFTAEYTLRLDSDEQHGRFGAMYASVGESRHIAYINSATKQLELVSEDLGQVVKTAYYDLVGDFDAHVWHSIRIEKRGDDVSVFVDGLLRATVAEPNIMGYIGYVTDGCKADFAYIASNNNPTDVNSLQTTLPVPGVLAAIHSTDSSAQIGDLKLSYGIAHFITMSAGDHSSYLLNPRAKGVYNVGLRYRSTSSSKVSVMIDDENVISGIVLPSTNGDEWNVYTLKNIALPNGNTTLRLVVDEGTIDLYELNVRAGVANAKVITDDFSGTLTKNWKHSEGLWKISDGVLNSPLYGKIISGGTSYLGVSDFSAEADICFTDNINGGMIFRVNNPSNGGAGNDPSTGSDFLQGYFFGLNSTGVLLGKQNYNWTQLASANMPIVLGTTYHIKVEAEGNTFKCYVDDMLHPVITYTDTLPFISGRVGLRTHNSIAQFDNFVLTPSSDSETDIVSPSIAENDSTTAGIEVYNIAGAKMMKSNNIKSAMNMLHKGIYIVRSEGKMSKIVLR